MSVLKVGSTPLASAIALPSSLAREVGERPPAPNGTMMDAELRRIQRPKRLTMSGVQPAASPDPAAGEADFEAAVTKANKALEAFATTSLRLSYDHGRRLVVMEVVKAAEEPGQPEEVIRQIPPEELLELIDRLEELQGIFFDRRI